MTSPGSSDRLSLEATSGGAPSCPLCIGTTRRSERRGWRDFIRHLLGRYPWRCRTCSHRFYAVSRQ